MSQVAVLTPTDTAAQIEQARADFLAACPADPAREESASPVQPRPLQLDISKYSGERYFSEFPPAFDWLLKGSLRCKTLGAMIGAPGSGKSTAAIQLAVAVAAGLPWLGAWEPAHEGRALYISAEDDELTLHRRVHHTLKTLPEQAQVQAMKNIFAVPVTGDVALCRGMGGDVIKTDALTDLRAILKEFRPTLLVLDTLARFLAVAENDNPAMTAACALLEEVCRDFDCATVLLHHTAKVTGALASDDLSLNTALEQTASRGASALAGCVRWQVNLAPLASKLAIKIIGEDAVGRADGAFLAVRVSKKNCGAPEPKYFFSRCEHGLLRRVEPVAQEQEAQSREADAAALVAEVKRRAEEGLEPLPVSKAGRYAFEWGETRNKNAVFFAVDSGLLAKQKSSGARGEILMLPTEEKGPMVKGPQGPQGRALVKNETNLMS
ncbi:AAA family ATPase [Desulfovibrio fairfieldensis]|uniref:AAA family ATPase n=1 Tax=Desulfovibrio fairfieldensis TaxID=44742 RepID=A0A0X8JK24_9BACT|nr:AAA family ATPase [Desulfovibrio fairfieldensis]AMD90239.1 hypothetical protein AXF13_08950 [Desulfovibrio fairfieldensis]